MSFRLITQSRYITWINVLVMIVTSWLFYFAFIILVNYGSEFNSEATMGVAFNSGKFYFDWVLVAITCFLIDYATNSYSIIFGSNIAGTLLILVSKRGGLHNNVDLPEKIVKMLKLYESYDDNNEVKESANVQDIDKIDNIHINIANTKKGVMRENAKMS